MSEEAFAAIALMRSFDTINTAVKEADSLFMVWLHLFKRTACSVNH